MIAEFDVTLTEQQAYDCLRKSEYFKTTGKRAVVQTAILAFMTVYFLIDFFLSDVRRPFPLVMAGICVIVVAAIWLVPYFGMRAQAKKSVTGKPFHVVVEEKRIRIGVGEKEWQIPVSRETYFREACGLLILKRADGVTTALPVDAFPTEDALEKTRSLFKS